MIKLVIFDFDGTLVDSKSYWIKTIRAEAAKQGYILKDNFEERLGDFPIKREIVIALLKKGKIFGIKKRVKELSDKIHKVCADNIGEMKKAEGISELRKIKKRKIILSHNSKICVNAFLKKHKIRFFSGVYSGEELGDKDVALRKLMEKYKVKNDETVYVADRVKDVKMSKKAGCYSIIVANDFSWSSKDALIAAEPDFLVGNLKDVVKAVNKLNSL